MNCIDPTRQPLAAAHARMVLTRGFTLIELMITLTIAVILIAIAIPSFNYLTVSNKLSTTANDLVSAINTARIEAIKRNNQVAFCGNAGNGTDTLGTACGTQTGAVYAILPNGSAALVRAGVAGVVAPIQIQSIPRLNFGGEGLASITGSTTPYTGEIADVFTANISSNNRRCMYMGTGSIIRTCTVTSTGACPNVQPNPCN